MAFDINDPADLATLKALVPDPNAPTQQILDDLNADTANVGIANMTADALLDAFLTQGVSVSSQDQFMVNLMFEVTGDIDDDLSRFRLQTRALSQQISGAIDTIVRFLTLAEVSFSDLDENGVNETVRISKADWIAARDS